MSSAGWRVTLLGSTAVTGVVVKDGQHDFDLQDASLTAYKEIKKDKQDKVQMALEFTSNAVVANPIQSGSQLYQPIAKVLFVHKHAKGKLISFVAGEDDVRVGAPDCKYRCYVFKTENDNDSRDIESGLDRMRHQHRLRLRPKGEMVSWTADQVQDAVSWWNDAKVPKYHYNITKDDDGNPIISAIMTFKCQVDPSNKAMSVKMVRLTSDIKGDELVKLLGEKFNITNVSFANYAVLDNRNDDGEYTMLEENENPIEVSLKWDDPGAGYFSLKSLPKGLQRIGAVAPSSPDAAGLTSNSTGTEEQTGSFNDDVLGPLLPFSEHDEDLLLSVMITRQSGSGLGFKLTPSYLLQMCIAYSFLHQETPSLNRFLTKMTSCIGSVMSENPTNPDLLLFWACNTMRLLDCFNLRDDLKKAYKAAVGDTLDTTLEIGIRMIHECSTSDKPLPAPLATAKWEEMAQLKEIISQHYQSLDSNMCHSNLQEVVERITAAMPSAHIRQKTLSDGGMMNVSSSTDAPTTSTPIMNPSGSVSDSRNKEEQQERPGVDPLPAEWEELTDQETRHRFFANHQTRQTSWTDPRDKLITVTLVKEQGRGLGLGLSGAKRTWDERLILGIFVSSLVQNSAAATEGTLREGDEILEVNGHSLIGVSREGAIDFLKEIGFGDTVTLLVSQEPETWVDPDREKAALRHTAL
eukprot:m.35912 g.35912  ORF g.35912 m.35912 type:complete len:691 (-) comp17226_c0_seq1:363-2435(-)